eukprot:TRINITY_DN11935_c0_g1_i1.p1 TRINITY_DN11935_c0_g1~~TRINITY_DN11935_c0_g1_i1.p1  ORF type:complete len:172 (-),score=34.03 TRINITY_DN11935_c0_g1_i1:50-565(-)
MQKTVLVWPWTCRTLKYHSIVDAFVTGCSEEPRYILPEKCYPKNDYDDAEGCMTFQRKLNVGTQFFFKLVPQRGKTIGTACFSERKLNEVGLGGTMVDVNVLFVACTGGPLEGVCKAASDRAKCKISITGKCQRDLFLLFSHDRGSQTKKKKKKKKTGFFSHPILATWHLT